MKYTLEDIQKEAERLKLMAGDHPTPWYAHECTSSQCWCKPITTNSDPGVDSMDVCVAASGSLHAKDAELIVAYVNSPLPDMVLELMGEHERLKEKCVQAVAECAAKVVIHKADEITASRSLLTSLGYRYENGSWVEGTGE